MGWGLKGEQHLCSLFCPFEVLWSLYFFLSGVSHPAAPGLLSRGMRARLLADPKAYPCGVFIIVLWFSGTCHVTGPTQSPRWSLSSQKSCCSCLPCPRGPHCNVCVMGRRRAGLGLKLGRLFPTLVALSAPPSHTETGPPTAAPHGGFCQLEFLVSQLYTAAQLGAHTLSLSPEIVSLLKVGSSPSRWQPWPEWVWRL